MKSVESAIERLKVTPGVISCWLVPEEDRGLLLRIEDDANHQMGLPGIEVVNEGIRDVLTRQHVIGVSHSSELRHSPGPIILIMKGDEIVGEEVWEPSDLEKLIGDENAFFLGKNLVLNRKAAKKAKGEILKLVYKGLPFPELNSISGIRDVVSATITVPAHQKLSGEAGWNSDDPSIGTFLIGFNESSSTNTTA